MRAGPRPRPGSVAAGCLAEELWKHLVGDSRRPLLAHDRKQSLAAFGRLVRIGLRPRVGENHTPKVTRRVAEQCERYVPPHRKTADDRILDVQSVQQIDDVCRAVVHRRHGSLGRAAIRATKVGSNHSPARFGECELRFPHSRVKGKCMDQDERIFRARR